MQAEQFNTVLMEVFEQVARVLGQKADEYAGDSDRLHNFKQAAHLQRIGERAALAGMMAKHTVSVYDMLDADECAPLAKWDEKILDHINYLILLRAIVVEELEGTS